MYPEIVTRNFYRTSFTESQAITLGMLTDVHLLVFSRNSFRMCSRDAVKVFFKRNSQKMSQNTFSGIPQGMPLVVSSGSPLGIYSENLPMISEF